MALALAVGVNSKKKSAPTSEQSVSFKQIAQDSVRPESAVIQTNKATPKECLDLFDKIETTPNQALLHDLAEGRLHFVPKCRELESPALKRLVDSVYASCGQMPPWDEKQKLACQESLLSYRAARLYQYNKGRAIKDLKNAELIQNIVALMATGAVSTPEGIKELLANSLELKERWPDSAPAAKSVALAEFLDMSSSFREPAADSLNRVLKAIQDSRRLDPKDWQTFELELFVQTQAEPENAQAKIANLTSQNPENPLSYYYLSWAAWNREDRASAIAYLEDALRLDPNSPRFRDTRQKIDNANFSDVIYSIQVGIGFEDL